MGGTSGQNVGGASVRDDDVASPAQTVPYLFEIAIGPPMAAEQTGDFRQNRERQRLLEVAHLDVVASAKQLLLGRAVACPRQDEPRGGQLDFFVGSLGLALF
jgi:hypothetical protein